MPPEEKPTVSLPRNQFIALVVGVCVLAAASTQTPITSAMNWLRWREIVGFSSGGTNPELSQTAIPIRATIAPGASRHPGG